MHIILQLMLLQINMRMYVHWMLCARGQWSDREVTNVLHTIEFVVQ